MKLKHTETAEEDRTKNIKECLHKKCNLSADINTFKTYPKKPQAGTYFCPDDDDHGYYTAYLNMSTNHTASYMAATTLSWRVVTSSGSKSCDAVNSTMLLSTYRTTAHDVRLITDLVLPRSVISSSYAGVSLLKSSSYFRLCI
jgi:hypothetical protein